MYTDARIVVSVRDCLFAEHEIVGPVDVGISPAENNKHIVAVTPEVTFCVGCLVFYYFVIIMSAGRKIVVVGNCRKLKRF